MTLYNELERANKLVTVKRSHFRGLSLLYGDRARAWALLDRNPSGSGSDIKSVYRHATSKGASLVSWFATELTILIVPSQSMIYQNMLALESKSLSSTSTEGRVAAFLNEGLKIQASQYA